MMWHAFRHSTSKTCCMKTNLLTYVLLLGAAGLVSCGSNESSEGSTDTTTTTTTTTTTDTGLGTTTPAGPTYSATPLQGQDSTFVLEAANAGMLEVELGNMAQQNAENPRVKAFGEMMVRDHSAANNELKSLASAKNLMLPDSLSKKQRDHVESMRKMTGKSFDSHYIDMMAKDHDKVVQKFEKASTSATDADLKAWATKTLPVLRTHLDSAKAINSKM